MIASSTSPANNASPKIAIIGAGPGGLTLARLLQIKDIPFTVYEKETSSKERPQGGTLDLHAESGQHVIKEAGLWSRVEKILRNEGEDFKLLDKFGFMHINEVNENGDRPEIDRLQLREVLLESIKPETIQWGHALLRVEPRQDGKYNLHFQDKIVKDFDLVVGADGAWSKVRSLVTEVAPHYSGISLIEVRFTDVDSKQPKIAKLVGRGSMFAFADNKGIIAQRNGDGSIKVYLALRVPEKHFIESGVDFSDAQESRNWLLKTFEDWSSDLQELILLCDDNFIPRPLYMLPVGHSWTCRSGITLLGDAAHLMTPFAGEGVNLAMLDALSLSEQIINNREDLSAAVEEYEKEMFSRAEEKARETLGSLELCFTRNAPIEFKEMMLSRGPPPQEALE